MPNENKSKPRKQKVLNIYAKDLKGNPIHVDEAESGRKGYYCLGCDKEMEARKSKIQTRSSYFAHVPTNVETEKKCTYSDETYRHKLAKEILQRIKKIKVPNLYKYPPFNTEGGAYKIQDSKFIDAAFVKNEIQFYENEEGIIQYGRNLEFKEGGEKHLLIQPDVTFFNKNGDPILFVEIVATHKVDFNKLLKLKRLGVDAIQVSIPKSSPEEIENTFYKTSRTEWLFNYEQETTSYISLPKENDQRVPSNNEFQRKLFEQYESYECKKAEINNLIRAIKKCLGSESYRSIERKLRSELFRVEENTKKHQRRLDDIRNEASRNAKKRTESKRKRLEEEEATFRTAKEGFQREINDMEGRYQRKRSEIIKSGENLVKKFTESTRDLRANCSGRIERIREQLETFGRTPTALENEIRRLELEEREVTENISNQIGRIGREQEEITSRRASLGKEYEYVKDGIRAEFREKERNLESRTNHVRGQLKKETEGYRRRVFEAVKNKDSEGGEPINKRIKKLLYERRTLLSIRDGKEDIKRLKTIKRILESGEFKKWI